MNIADMLAYTDIHQLGRIADHYDCECSTNSKNELIQSILAKVNRREIFEQMVDSLSLEDLRFLNSIIFDQRNAFSLEELIARAKQTKFSESTSSSEKPPEEDWNPRETIRQFKQRGWLFNGHSHQTQYLFTIPNDIKRRIGDSLENFLKASIETVEEPDMYREEEHFFLEDMKRFLQYLQLHEVVLTGDGFIYKRQLQQILQSFQIEEQLPGKAGWRFGYGRKFKEYPNRFSLLYDYCFYHQYIAELDGTLELTEQGKRAIQMEGLESPNEVYRFWIRLYKGPIRNIQAMVHWIHRLTDRWTTLASLKQTLCPLIKPYYYDSSEAILEQRILLMMAHLGLLRVGQHADRGGVVQITTMGKQVISGAYVEEKDRIELPDDSR